MFVATESLSICDAARLIGVSPVTLRRWDREEKLKPSHRTLGRHRRYTLESLDRFLPPKNSSKMNVGYARVSSHDQKEDLTRQIEVLRSELTQTDTPHEVISDLGSGMNFRKKGLKRLLNMIVSSKVSTLYLTHTDRLLRFGSELVFHLCDYFGTNVVILGSKGIVKTDEELFAEDVIELITVFSARLYGKRSHKNRLTHPKPLVGT